MLKFFGKKGEKDEKTEKSAEPVVNAGLIVNFEQISHENAASETEELFLEEYAKAAKEAGLTAGPALGESIRFFLAKNKIKIYKTEDVKKFLNATYGEILNQSENKPGWIWRPTSIIERDKGLYIENIPGGKSGQINNSNIYNHPIPLFAVRLMADIRKEIPGVDIYVSDANLPQPDPFLMVTGFGNVPHFIIAHWNEPGFKE